MWFLTLLACTSPQPPALEFTTAVQRVNTERQGEQDHTSVAHQADGTALITWAGNELGGRRVFTRPVRSDGRVHGKAQPVSDKPLSHPQLLAVPDGYHLIAEWNRTAQVVELPLDRLGTPTGPLAVLPIDGRTHYPDVAFQSGVVRAWLVEDPQRLRVFQTTPTSRDLVLDLHAHRSGPVAIDADSSAMWLTYAASTSDGTKDIFLAQVTDDIGPPIRIAEARPHHHLVRPDLAVHDGTVAVAWCDDEVQELYLAFADLHGVLHGPPTQLDTHPGDRVALAHHGDHLAIAWERTAEPYGIVAQLWSITDRAPITPPLPAIDLPATRPDISIHARDGTVSGLVTWERRGADAKGRGVEARAFQLDR